MSMEQTWRWFGPQDPIKLDEVKQTGATGIVTALHHVPAGEQWTVEEIMKRKREIESAGLRWSVAESLPVHEGIKTNNMNCGRLVENYKISLSNLGRCGVETVCYNFMPVLDWSRTDLGVEFKDGSITSKFESRVFAAFDLHILKREGAEADYTEDEARNARQYFDTLSERQRDALVQTVLLGFPGSGEAYTLAQLKDALHMYDSIGENELRHNLTRFLKEIVPVAEESGVRLAIHPDDPPFPLLGLPRIVSNKRDVEQILAAYDSTSNGITLCTGSFGAGMKNDLQELTELFAPRINFIHLRNVTKDPQGDFVEDNHLEGDVDMYGVIRTLLLEQKRRTEDGRKDIRIPMRPDHGHLMKADQERAKVYPGYSLFGRMRGLAELRGVELGIRRSLGL
ncbi:MAG: mannonate dehydratase [Ignavibacteriales bacterium]|nr:mannonate dehydratase [Ignavibacteriales bacterium]